MQHETAVHIKNTNSDGRYAIFPECQNIFLNF